MSIFQKALSWLHTRYVVIPELHRIIKEAEEAEGVVVEFMPDDRLIAAMESKGEVKH